MEPNLIKAKLLVKVGSIERVAREINESRPAVSSTINYLRVNQRIREKLARKYGIKFTERPLRRASLERSAA